METPIVDFVRSYAQSGTARLHMPGHKGQAYLGPEALDITEVCGADALYEADGIIAASEKNAASLFGSGHTFYSCEGSSLAIRAILYLLCVHAARRGLGRTVLAARNVHKSFVHACALLDVDVRWLYGANGSCLWSDPVSPEQLETALSSGPLPMAVYVTSPDYLGQMCDIAGLSRVCRTFGVPLAVDNAHGAYLHFLKTPLHPLDLGAQLCCDSAHKTLPALTGAAYLHISKEADPVFSPLARDALSLFGSTSPSYLILQSLDLCNRVLAGPFPEKLSQLIPQLSKMRSHLSSAGLPVLDGEPMKLTLDTGRMGLSGRSAAQALREQGIEAEFADDRFLVMMPSPDTPARDLQRLESALLMLRGRPGHLPPLPPLRPLQRALSIRDAVLSAHRRVPLKEAEGKICALPTVSCPPAIPIAVSGERFDADALRLLSAFGIEQVDIVEEA